MNPAPILYVLNVDWFFLSHRLPIALEAQRRGYQVHVALGLTTHAARLRALGFVVHPLHLDRSSMSPLAALRNLTEIYRVIRAVRPRLVHLVTIKPVLLGGVAARLARAPAIVAAVPGLGYVFGSRGALATLRRGLIGALYRLALSPRHLRVIVQNKADHAVITRRFGVDENRVVTIRGSGVDLDRFRPRPLPEGPPVVALVARLLGDKGVREFVAAAAMLRDAVAARFVLVGEPDPGNPATIDGDELAGWQRAGTVEWWGRRDDIEEVMRSASLVVLPSYHEGLPKVLLEAAACARPVVASDIAGCREAVVHGETGLLVPARDAAALAGAIRELLQDPQRRAAMGRAARLRAEREFDVRDVVARHHEVYAALLGEPAP